ncbi:MAG TPA: transporter [Azospirillum sp.]|nr:transporter [Azospirillum sp.]
MAAALAAVTSIVSPSADATEANSQYPNGAEGFMAGAVPPPGLYLINYVNYYHAGRINDNSGNKLPIPVRLDAVAEVPRIIYVSDVKILGANWGAHILVPVVNLDYDIGPFSARQFGLGDITINPAILSWHFPNLHVATGLDIILPTGRYDRTKPVSIGTNYWGIEPLVAATYLSDGGFEVSAKLMYAFNTKNNDTNYRSGQAFHADYMVAQHLGDWALGVGGYWFQQTTDDTRNGIDIGNRGMAFAAGPAVKYDFNGMSLIGKWQHEFTTENRPQGDNYWIKFIMRF